MLSFIGRIRFPLAAMLAIWGCSCEQPDEPEEIPKECRDDIIVGWNEADPPANRRGQIKLSEQHHADGSDTTTVVYAVFQDYSLYNGTSQEPLALGETCIGLHGQPVRSDKHCEYTDTSCVSNDECEPDVDCRETDRLDVAGVHVEGLAAGDIDLDEQEMGRFVKAGLSNLYAGRDIQFAISAASGTHAFMPMDVDSDGIPSPEQVKVTKPDLSGGVSIGREDLMLRWKPGSDPDQFVYIDIKATQISVSSPDITRSVGISCVALDDGCQGIWATNLQWLMQADADWMLDDKVTVIVSRRSQNTQSVPDIDDTQLTISFSTELRGEMKP